MKTEGFKIDSRFNGGFCASFFSVNKSKKTCKNFAVEVSMDPGLWSVSKQTPSLRMVKSDKKAGACHAPGAALCCVRM